jgi:hypothetical protein
MRIGSILIGGIERAGNTLLRDFEIVQDSGDRMGTAKMLILYDPDSEPTVGNAILGNATLGTAIVTGQLVEIFSTTAGSAEGGNLFGEPLFGDVEFGSDAVVTAIFRGNITNIERQVMVAHGATDGSGTLWGEPEFGGPLFGEGSGAYRVNLVRIECRDWNSLLDNAIVAPGTPGFSGRTDQYIITTLCAATQPDIDLTDVSSTAVLSTFDQVENQSLRSILTRLSDQSGAFWYVDQNKALHWFLPSSRPAPFSLSEQPDGVNSFPFDRQDFRYTEEWRTPANRVTVLGEVSTAGARVRETMSDSGSIAAFGTFGRTISDRSITSSAQAKARARVELANYAYPTYNGIISQRKAGLTVGEMLTINVPTLLHLNNAFVIRRIRMTWWSRITTNYEIEWGSYRPDLARAIRAAFELAANGQPTAVQPTTPVDGSVGSSTIIPGSVNNAALGAGSVSNANIQSLAVGSANIQDGAIQTAHIADAQITNAKIGNLEVNNAKIDYGLSATKITVDDLTVGGSGHVGQLLVKDASGNAIGFIGGSADGGWLKALAVGGSSLGSAKFKADNNGNISVAMDSSDTFTITGSGSSITLRIISGYGHVEIGGNVVVSDRQTGWSLMGGTSTRNTGSYNTSSITLVQLAEVVRAVVQDLLNHGLIGA